VALRSDQTFPPVSVRTFAIPLVVFVNNLKSAFPSKLHMSFISSPRFLIGHVQFHLSFKGASFPVVMRSVLDDHRSQIYLLLLGSKSPKSSFAWAILFGFLIFMDIFGEDDF